MAEYLLIVARGHLRLYDYLTRQFSEVKKVQVLLDRRQGKRRQRVQRHEPERRRADRRHPPDSYPRTDWFVSVRQQTD